MSGRTGYELVIREVKAEDAPAIARLIATLGYEAAAGEVAARLEALGSLGHPVLVAEQGAVVAVLTTSVTAVLHRPRPVGRVSMLVVDEQCRGAGIGAILVAEAERQLAAKGCGLVEVTSNRRRERAHAFYERLGYERTSYRFAKPFA